MFSSEDLRKVINYETIGEFFPYFGGTDDDIGNYIKSVVADLNRSSNIKAEADFSMYGSGYASYVDVFCTKRDGSSISKKGYSDWIDGISLYICRLAPVAVLGCTQLTKHSHGGSWEFLCPNKVDTSPQGDWESFINEIKIKVCKYSISVLDRDYISKMLPFKAKIPTILGEEPYSVFDAFFYWED